VNTTKAKERKKAYRDLIRVAEETYTYGCDAMRAVGSISIQDSKLDGYVRRLGEMLELMESVIDQTKLKNMGVKDVSFSKKRGMKILDMVRSSWVYKQLHRFRAGVEGCISTLKRVFNLNRCDWRGMDAFKSYVWSGVVTYNLVVLARHMLE